MSELLKRPILITGSSSGIGFELSKRLILSGAKQLIISGRSNDKLSLAVEELATLGNSDISPIVLDQSCKESVDVAAKSLVSDGIAPITLVCNVGINPVHKEGPKKVQNTDYEQFLDTFKTNVANSLKLIQLCLPEMRSSGFGRIYLVGSQAYQYGIPGQVSYNVSKSALVGLANTINREYEKKNIHCRLFNVGMVNNDRTQRIRKKVGSQAAINVLSEEDVARKIICHMLENEDVSALKTEVNIV